MWVLWQRRHRDRLSAGNLDLQSSTTTGVTYTNSPVTVSGNSQITSDRSTSAQAGDTYTFGTLSIGAQTLTIAGGANVNSGAANITFGAVTATAASTFTVTNPVNGGTTLLTIASLAPTAASTVTFNGNGNTTITGAISTTTAPLTMSAQVS